MKKVKAENGGRPFANDDLLVLQQELTDAVQAQFLGKGPFVLSGCTVSGPAAGATVTAGIVCLDGQLLRFAGASGVPLPAQFQAGAVLGSDLRPYQTGGSKYCASEVPAVLSAADPAYVGGEFLPVDTWGAKMWAHVQASQQRTVGEVQWLASLSPADYDAAGLGKPGTAAWGWGLCDGQGSRLNLGGRVAVGRDASRSDYDTVGKTGGAESVSLTADQNGPHTHVVNLDLKSDGGANSNTTSAMYGNNGSYIAGKPSTQQSGSGALHENRQPYAVLTARQWVGF